MVCRNDLGRSVVSHIFYQKDRIIVPEQTGRIVELECMVFQMAGVSERNGNMKSKKGQGRRMYLKELCMKTNRKDEGKVEWKQ